MSKRLEFPATARNRDPILAVLREVFEPPIRRVLEIGSGSGEHAVHFARALPHIVWQPTDIAETHLESIDAWRVHEALDNVLPAIHLDPRTDPFPSCDAIFCANVIHISAWEVALGIFQRATMVLPPGGLLVFYGPFKKDGVHTAPSNETFDASLVERNPTWGVRDMTEVEAALAPAFVLTQAVAMPANNFTLVFRRARTGG